MKYPRPSKELIQLFKCHSSAAGVEWNRKVNKLVQNTRRARLGNGKVERQVLVVHNFVTLEPKLGSSRSWTQDFGGFTNVCERNWG